MSNLIVRSMGELQVVAKVAYESNFYGFKNQAQAMAACIASQDMGMNATKFMQDFHIIGAKPTKKTETAYRDFKKAGGRCKWIHTDDKYAEAELIAPDGDSITMKYTIEQAKRAGLYKDNYLKNPEDMFRSRVLSKGIKAIYPQAYDGFLSDDEALDIYGSDDTQEVIETAEIVDIEKDIKAMKVQLKMKLKKLDFSDSDIQDFARYYQLNDTIETLEKLVSDEDELLNYVNQFENKEI